MQACPHCGTQNADTAEKCSGCGGALRTESAQSSTENAEQKSERYISQIRRLTRDDQKTRPRVIVMFGDSTSGKTFFIERAKYDRLGYANIRPQGQRSEPIKGTEGIETHTFANRGDIMIFVDVEGDRFSAAMRFNFEVAFRPYLEAIAHADGLIFLLPATRTLVPDSYARDNPAIVAAKDDAEKLENLLSSVTSIAAFQRFIAARRIMQTSSRERTEQSTQAAVDAYLNLSEEERVEALRSEARSDKPALLLLSKGDVYGEFVGRDDYDADPWGSLATAETPAARILVKAFQDSFARFRVDFVTACEGHVEFPDPRNRDVRDTIFDPTRTDYGVVSSLKWMKQEIDRSRSILRRLAPGVSVGIGLRKALDRNF
jgi:hypothetical protein